MSAGLASAAIHRVKLRWPRRLALQLIAYAFIGFCLFPIYIVVATALKPQAAIFERETVWLFEPTFENFAKSMAVGEGGDVLRYIGNGALITLASTLLASVLGAMAAYGLARFRFTGDRHLAFWILSTRMAPPVAFIVPIYLMVQRLDLHDSHLALIVLYTGMNLSFVTWVLRGFFKEIPPELEEAALVDGYSRLQIFMRVALPLVRPGLAATAVISAIFAWNELLYAVILTQSDAQTLPIYLTRYQAQLGIDWGQLMAVAVVAVVPIMLFTLSLQRHLVRGLTFGAVR